MLVKKQLRKNADFLDRFVPDQLVRRTAKTASVCTNSDGTNRSNLIVYLKQ